MNLRSCNTIWHVGEKRVMIAFSKDVAHLNILIVTDGVGGIRRSTLKGTDARMLAAYTSPMAYGPIADMEPHPGSAVAYTVYINVNVIMPSDMAAPERFIS
ncbi:unnamed protein product [Fraxinus pennsylvanica]|uniref:Uncharacterized protein n=1 Tax=Fraxinus pennsylvanica TaxID=56036 RepID=A0AAD1ZHS3_9LAMI|nr:unnamed protein product [Fraxinus pennsylvanica]